MIINDEYISNQAVAVSSSVSSSVYLYTSNNDTKVTYISI